MDNASIPRPEKKQLLRSCEACRTSKIKCVPGDVSDEKCQRCARIGRHCVFSEGRAWRKKRSSSQTRIVEVEKKIDSIYSLLQTGSALPGRSVSHSPEMPTPSSLISGESASRDSVTSFYQAASPNALDVRDSSLHSEETSGAVDVIQKGILTVQDAEALLNSALVEYRGFPWLVFPSELPFSLFRCERPFLLLGLLVLASRKKGRLYESLQSEFKKIISAKVIMDGVPDLDLLQGLLVYLAWFHLHPDAPPHKMYMLTQIAVAMSADLQIPSLIANESNSALKAELQRTYLAVYYLSSCDSMVSRKPISIRYNDFVGKCCRSLAATNHASTDADLIHFIGLQRLAEEISSTFGYDMAHNVGLLLKLELIELSIKAFTSRLHDLRRSFPSNSTCLPSLMLAYENTCIYLHEVSLYIEQSSTGSLTPLSHEADNSSQKRITLLLSCLEATKSYLDCFLQIPPELCTKHSTQEKGSQAHAITVLIKLAFCSNLGPDNFPLRDACNVSYYVDAMSEHMGSACVNKLDDGTPDSVAAFKTMAERIKDWYERTEFFEHAGTLSDLKNLSPVQFVKIAKEEQLMNFDFSNLDFSFLEGPNSWS